MAPTEDLHGQIARRVGQVGATTLADLAQHLSAPAEDVRRAAEALRDEGAIMLDGENVGPPLSTENIAYEARQRLHRTEKELIAQTVAARIPDHASLFINIGTTTEAVARELMGHSGLRVVTNNLNVASIMSDKPDFEVIIAGGIVRSRDRGVVGEATIDLVRQFRVDFGIIGISGIDERGALLDYDYREVRVAQAIVEQSQRVFLCTDATKFGRFALVRLGHISQLDAVFTDEPPPTPYGSQLEAAGVEVVVARSQ